MKQAEVEKKTTLNASTLGDWFHGQCVKNVHLPKYEESIGLITVKKGDFMEPI